MARTKTLSKMMCPVLGKSNSMTFGGTRTPSAVKSLRDYLCGGGASKSLLSPTTLSRRVHPRRAR